MVDCCGFQASLTLSGGGWWERVGEKGKKKKRKPRETTARQTEDEQREGGGSLFKRASTVTVCGRITWLGGCPCFHSLSFSQEVLNLF